MRKRWTRDIVLAEGLKYNHRVDFIRNSQSAYNRARKDGYLDVACSHMIPIGNRVLRMVYSYEFSDNHVYVGLTYNIEKRNASHLLKGPVFNHIQKSQIIPKRKIISKNYIPWIEAGVLEQKTIDEYKNNGWNILNTSKGGGMGGKEIKWTKDEILKESLKYNTRTQFRRNSPKGYDAAIRNKLLNTVCSHMTHLNKSWTKEKIQNVAAKYNRRGDFQKYSPNEYSIAHKHKWINDVCSHMKPSQTNKEAYASLSR